MAHIGVRISKQDKEKLNEIATLLSSNVGCIP